MKLRALAHAGAATAAGMLLVFGLTLPASAQQTGRIGGQVVDASTGQPLQGVQISVQGTGVGTVTDARGRYLLLNAPTGAQTLRVQSIGYADQAREVNVQAGQTVTANFELTTQAISLDAVVATGTAGNARRREMGTSVSLISSKELQEAPILEVSDALQGRAAGLTIREQGGYVGGGNKIVLRGVNTISGSISPLIYVDGVRLESGTHGFADEINQAAIPLDDIDPSSIERIEIVKGAAATTLYGTEAAGGVIQIFTNGGGGERTVWNFQVEQGINNMGHVGPEEDPTGLNINDCSAEPGCPASGSWLQNGHIQEYSLSVRGGTDVPYYASASWGRQEGVVAPQSAENFSLRANFTYEPFDNLSIRSNNMFSRRDITWIPDGNNAEGFLINVMRGERGYTPGNDDSLVFDMDINQMIDHFMTGLNINWTPIDGMLHRFNIGLDYSSSDYTEERPWGFWYQPQGEREADLDLDRNWTVDYAGSWNTAVPFLSDIASTFSWGAQYYDEFSWGVNGFGERFAGPGPKLIGSAVETDASEQWTRVASGGFFLQEQIGWKDRLFVTVGARWDGFSTFGEDFGIAMYPKISAAYTISDHDFWPDWWEAMKLRGALGESGRAPGPFDAKRTWESVSGDTRQPGVAIENLGNIDLGPERTRELELGFEGSLLDSRVSYDFTYFDQETRDALFNLRRPPSVGTEEAILTNLGVVENRGFELTANFGVLRTRDLSWDLGGHYSTAENEIVKLDPNVADDRRLGRPVDAIFGDVVINPDEVGVRPKWEEQYLGNVIPARSYGINTSVTVLRRLTLNALAEGQGDYVHEAGVIWAQVGRQKWAPCQYVFDAYNAKDLSNITARERGLCHPRERESSMWTQDASFWKIRSVSASYRVPEEWLPGTASALTLRLQGRNLYTWTDYPGLDPEVAENGAADRFSEWEYYQLPPPRQFLFSANVTF